MAANNFTDACIQQLQERIAHCFELDDPSRVRASIEWGCRTFVYEVLDLNAMERIFAEHPSLNHRPLSRCPDILSRIEITRGILYEAFFEIVYQPTIRTPEAWEMTEDAARRRDPPPRGFGGRSFMPPRV